MSDLIERMAEALYRDIWHGETHHGWVDNPDTILRADGGRKLLSFVTFDGSLDMRALAKAALQAIREPTEAMLNAQVENYHGGMQSVSGYLDDVGAKAVWQAMIDEALAESDQSREAK